ncbi:MAG: hypothetical protein F9K32_02120 [Desulfobulbaceae bacterium]|nr:MAG: hypothetical protein F9K32_02120 [Desulfobulbaceae bacterium]
MKIVFNSKLPDAASSAFYHDGLQRLHNISFFDYEHWHNYDVALFMTYKPDLEDLKAAKTSCPSLVTAIVDPRGSWVKSYLEYADFLIVDSIEMRDYWAYTGLPIFEYAEFPDLKVHKKTYSHEDQKIIIGYHGNKIHLDSMRNTIVPALERLSRETEIELWAMYNIAALGRWDRNMPGIEIRHIQWSMENYYEYMARVDIGIVPCFLPERNWSAILDMPLLKKFNRYRKNGDDYLLRFKMPTNPGRIIVWGLLNIPVVSDFFPSAMQCIDDGKNGLLACSSGGWYQALKRFADDPRYRQLCADKLTESVVENYGYDIQNERLMAFLQGQFDLGQG